MLLQIGAFTTLGFKMLLRMGLLLRLGPNVVTDRTFITLVPFTWFPMFECVKVILVLHFELIRI